MHGWSGRREERSRKKSGNANDTVDRRLQSGQTIPTALEWVEWNEWNQTRRFLSAASAFTSTSAAVCMGFEIGR